MRSVNGEIIGAVLYCILATVLWATDTVTVADMNRITSNKSMELIIIALIFGFIISCGFIYRAIVKK